MQSWSTGDFGVVAVNTVVEQVADGRIWVREVAVLTGTILVAFRGLWKKRRMRAICSVVLQARLQVRYGDVVTKLFHVKLALCTDICKDTTAAVETGDRHAVYTNVFPFKRVDHKMRGGSKFITTLCVKE
jgi:hypothetical protein